MNIPLKITAGDSLSWQDEQTTDNLGNPLSPGDWTLSYALRGPIVLDIVATVSNNLWISQLTATQTATFPAGPIYWQAFVTKGAQRITIGAGQIKVSANLSAASINFDGRTQNKKDLEAVQAAIRQLIAGGAIQRYTIGNRQVEKMSMTDLLELESKLKFRVATEERASRIANGEGDPRNLLVRFKK